MCYPIFKLTATNSITCRANERSTEKEITIWNERRKKEKKNIEKKMLLNLRLKWKEIKINSIGGGKYTKKKGTEMQQTVVDLVGSSGRKWINHNRSGCEVKEKKKIVKKWFDHNNWNNIDYMFNKITQTTYSNTIKRNFFFFCFLLRQQNLSSIRPRVLPFLPAISLASSQIK